MGVSGESGGKEVRLTGGERGELAIRVGGGPSSFQKRVKDQTDHLNHLKREKENRMLRAGGRCGAVTGEPF